MNKFKHTGRINDSDSRQNIDVVGEDGRIIVEHFDPRREREITALIVAAPKLLELCKRAVNQSARVHGYFRTELLEAIDKAEGKA